MNSVSNSNNKENVKEDKQFSATVLVSANVVDTGAALVYGDHSDLDPVQAARVRRKIDCYILPFMCSMIQFMDKTTLGSAAILGINEATHLTATELGTIFYVGYLMFQFPQNLALQRFPVGKWMSFNIFFWGVALCCHAACKNFGELFAVRMILGICEGFLIVSTMFYTRSEQTLRVGYWYMTSGTSQIISGFVSFGCLHIQTSGFEPWRWLMVITGSLTIVTAISFWLFFPDSPTTAWFLTPQERAIAVMRLKENQTGVENKSLKKEQMIEALTDPKTWLFVLFAGLDNVPKRLRNQISIIISSFGFTVLQTTLLGCVTGAIETMTIWTGAMISTRTGSRAWVAVFYLMPNILGPILLTNLPWGNKVGLLFSVWLMSFGMASFAIALSWISAITAGHTKRVTTNAIVLGAYCVGNALGPLMWEAKYKPRNRIPWIVTAVCYAASMLILLVIRSMLIRENKRRDADSPVEDGYDKIFIQRLAEDGSGDLETVKVDKELLDLTDVQNRDFRYVY
ncbi:major facilitator superfamily domain-containing protein [Mycena crocata]|nr:major facilitator superfamily domain-containing protein [Mycena crocata]